MGSNVDVAVRLPWLESLKRRKLRLRWGSVSLVAIMLLGCAAGTAPSLADRPDVSSGGTKAEVTLKKGDRGPAVAAVQRRLGLGPDGVFGALTHRAVKRFQRRRGLAVDGIVGAVTRAALRLRPFSHKSVFQPRKKQRGGGGGAGRPNMPEALVRIAECESGGDPTAVSASGLYRGKYQFMRSTWKAWGGRGSDPAEASEAEQDGVALRLYRARGTAPWPNCG